MPLQREEKIELHYLRKCHFKGKIRLQYLRKCHSAQLIENEASLIYENAPPPIPLMGSAHIGLNGPLKIDQNDLKSFLTHFRAIFNYFGVFFKGKKFVKFIFMILNIFKH